VKLLPPCTPLLARIVNSITQCTPVTDYAPFDDARGLIPGWSQPFHYTFFGHVLAALPMDRPRVLVCGVYHGLDLALIQHAAKILGKTIELTGVDLFSDQPCADWPEEKRHLTWEKAFNCPPPSRVAATLNSSGARVIERDAAGFMAHCGEKFDFIYLDTAHDEATVRDEIYAACVHALEPGGLLAGDDYHQPGTCWGVAQAVAHALPRHVVLFNRIWLAQP
jgi:hypothetical protein